MEKHKANEQSGKHKTLYDLVTESIESNYSNFKKFALEKFGTDGDASDETLALALTAALAKGAEDLSKAIEYLVKSYELLKLSTRFAEERGISDLTEGELKEATNLLVAQIEEIFKQVDLGIFNESSTNAVRTEGQASNTL